MVCEPDLITTVINPGWNTMGMDYLLKMRHLPFYQKINHSLRTSLICAGKPLIFTTCMTSSVVPSIFFSFSGFLLIFSVFSSSSSLSFAESLASAKVQIAILSGIDILGKSSKKVRPNYYIKWVSSMFQTKIEQNCLKKIIQFPWWNFW